MEVVALPWVFGLLSFPCLVHGEIAQWRLWPKEEEVSPVPHASSLQSLTNVITELGKSMWIHYVYFICNVLGSVISREHDLQTGMQNQYQRNRGEMKTKKHSYRLEHSYSLWLSFLPFVFISDLSSVKARYLSRQEKLFWIKSIVPYLFCPFVLSLRGERAVLFCKWTNFPPFSISWTWLKTFFSKIS